MSITYPQFPDTKFPDELDNFQRFIDITLDTYALAKEFESKFRSGDIAGAYALLEENPQLKRSYIGAATLNPIIDAINALQLLFTESIQEYLMNIVKPQGGYSPTVKYKKYDVVLYANNSALETYMCFRNDTPIGTLPTNTNYWWSLTLRGERGLPGTGLVPYGIWSPYITYPKDALVTYNNILWASSEENTNVIPSINSSVWYKVLEINVNDLTYIDSTTNIPYRYIIDDGRIYFENIIDNTRIEVARIKDMPTTLATHTSDGLMSANDKAKLDGIEAGANKYIHPTGDGNLHVPATGMSNNGKFLKAGSSAGSLSWSNITVNDVSGAAPLASPIFTGTPKAPTGTDYTVSRIRNIRFGTTVPTSLENGEIYFLYE